MAAIDTFVRLIQDLRQGQLVDDTDPNNTVLNAYSSPFDQVSQSESVRSLTSQTRVWGDGKTYTAYDSSGNPFAAPSCGWLWGAGGRW
jgi:hypothetical protein